MTITIAGLSARVHDWDDVEVAGAVVNGGSTASVNVTGVAAGSQHCDSGGNFSGMASIDAITFPGPDYITVTATDGHGVFSAGYQVAVTLYACSLAGTDNATGPDTGGTYTHALSGSITTDFSLPSPLPTETGSDHVHASFTYNGSPVFAADLPVDSSGNFSGNLYMPFTAANVASAGILIEWCDPLGKRWTGGIYSPVVGGE